MKFKIDENLPAEIKIILRGAGHDALDLGDQAMLGAKDKVIANICRAEQRAIVTLDTDFADIRTYPPDEYSGIIVLRLSRQDKPYVMQIIQQTLEKFAVEPLIGKLWIVEDRQIRIRG
jgi:predicted nuclease of predicted toxin-antitoxin system